MNPYGVDWTRFGATPPADRTKRPFRFLFLGSHLARKGLPVLLDARRALGSRRGDAELWLAGHLRGTRTRPSSRRAGLEASRARAACGRAGAARASRRVRAAELLRGLWLSPARSARGRRAVHLHAGHRRGRPAPTMPGSAVSFRRVRPRRCSPRAGKNPSRNHLKSGAAVRAAVKAIEPQFSWEAYGDRWATLLRRT